MISLISSSFSFSLSATEFFVTFLPPDVLFEVPFDLYDLFADLFAVLDDEASGVFLALPLDTLLGVAFLETGAFLALPVDDCRFFDCEA